MITVTGDGALIRMKRVPGWVSQRGHVIEKKEKDSVLKIPENVKMPPKITELDPIGWRKTIL